MKRVSKIILGVFTPLFLAGTLYAAGAAESPDYLYSKAMMLKAQKEYTKAIAAFTDLLSSGNGTDRLNYQIASCYASLPDYVQAQTYARKAIAANPAFTDPYQLIYDINMTLKNYEAAADVLEDLTEANPLLVQFHLMKGSLYYQNMNNYLMAAASLKKVLDISEEMSVPTSFKEQAHLLLSDIALQQKDYEKALKELDQAVELNPRNNGRYYRLASFFITNGNLDSAREAIEHFLPGIPDAQKNNVLIKTMYAYLGNIYYMTDDPKALLYLRLGASSENIDCFAAQYIFYAATDRKDEAVPILEKITAEYPKYASPNIALARVALEKGDTAKAYDCFINAAQLLYKTDMPEAAIECYLQALKIKPDTPEIHLILGQLYENTGKTAAAIMHFSKYNAGKPDVEILLHLAYIYDNEGKNERSHEYLLRAQTEYPESSRVPFFQGVLAGRANHNGEAERYLQKAIELKADDHNYYFYLASTRERLGKMDGAADALKKAIELDPENASYLNFLGYIYADTNTNLDQAFTLIEKALAKEPANGAFLDSLGWVYYRQGKYDLAVAKLKQARRTLAAADNHDPVVYDHLGDAYLKAGDKEKAAASWEKALEAKDTPAVRKKLNELK